MSVPNGSNSYTDLPAQTDESYTFEKAENPCIKKNTPRKEARRLEEQLSPVGIYPERFNDILGLSLPCGEILQSAGLAKHIKKKHPTCLDYISRISEIIKFPDYIGCNPREPQSVELVKLYDKNILLAVKLDTSKNYLYVASLYDISQSKIENRLYNGRLRKYEQLTELE